MIFNNFYIFYSEQVGECSDNAESSELQDASETQEAEYDNLIKKLLEGKLLRISL